MPCPYMRACVCVSVCVWSCAGSAAAVWRPTPHVAPIRSAPHPLPQTLTHTHTRTRTSGRCQSQPSQQQIAAQQAPPKNGNCATTPTLASTSLASRHAPPEGAKQNRKKTHTEKKSRRQRSSTGSSFDSRGALSLSRSLSLGCALSGADAALVSEPV